MQVLLNYFIVEFNSKSRRFQRQWSKPFINQLPVVCCFHKTLPPWQVYRVMFKGQEILGSSGTMYIGHKRNGSTSLVHGHSDSLFFCVITYPLGFQQSAR